MTKEKNFEDYAKEAKKNLETLLSDELIDYLNDWDVVMKRKAGSKCEFWEAMTFCPTKEIQFAFLPAYRAIVSEDLTTGEKKVLPFTKDDNRLNFIVKIGNRKALENCTKKAKDNLEHLSQDELMMYITEWDAELNAYIKEEDGHNGTYLDQLTYKVNDTMTITVIYDYGLIVGQDSETNDTYILEFDEGTEERYSQIFDLAYLATFIC